MLQGSMSDKKGSRGITKHVDLVNEVLSISYIFGSNDYL